MHERLAQREAFPAVRAAHDAARLELHQSQRALPVVPLCEVLQRLDEPCVLARAQQVLGRLLEAHDGDACDGHDEDEGARGEHGICQLLCQFM